MGHSRLGGLPRTRKWQQVVGLIERGASVGQVANATIQAAEGGFLQAANDQGVVESVHMLMQLPLAAKAENWLTSLKDIGISVKNAPTLLELVSQVSECLDAKLANTGKRSDLGEMAQNALTETLIHSIGKELPTLYSPSPDDVKHAISKCTTVKHFGEISRQFFAKLTDKYLAYFWSKTVPAQIGPGRRFATLSQANDFNEARKLHCFEASKIVEQFSGEWFSKTNWQQQGIPRSEVKKFTFGAMNKITKELKEGTK